MDAKLNTMKALLGSGSPSCSGLGGLDDVTPCKGFDNSTKTALLQPLRKRKTRRRCRPMRIDIGDT